MTLNMDDTTIKLCYKEIELLRCIGSDKGFTSPSCNVESILNILLNDTC